MVAQIDRTYLRMAPGRVWSRLIAYALFEGRPATTRGQWINPVLAGLFRMIALFPPLKAIDRPVFILGIGRSGTTILGTVLSTHPDIGFLNEPKLLWHAVHDGEDVAGSYSAKPGRYRLAASEATPERCRKIRQLYGAYLRLATTRRILDKYPELVFRFAFVKALFPDAKFIFLSRDGWDICTSIAAWSERFGVQEHGHTADWWGVGGRKWRLLLEEIVPHHADLAPHQAALAALTSQREMAAVEWIVTMRQGLLVLAEAGADARHLRYEDLCGAPEASIAAATAFIGLDPHPRPALFARSVLQTGASAAPFDLPEFLKTPFAATQKALGHQPARWAK